MRLPSEFIIHKDSKNLVACSRSITSLILKLKLCLIFLFPKIIYLVLDRFIESLLLSNHFFLIL